MAAAPSAAAPPSFEPLTGARLPLPGVRSAQAVLLVGPSLEPDRAFFVDALGFRVAAIGPADAPTWCALEGYGLRLRLEAAGPAAGAPGVPGAPGAAALVELLCDDVAAAAAAAGGRELRAPCGASVVLLPADAEVVVPRLPAEDGEAAPAAAPLRSLARAAAGGGFEPGRAGLLYRDLLPGRLGGRLIASHIRVEQGGPVPDYVHWHAVRLQLVFVRRGWVEVVYEDAGPPFTMRAGDCVLQPPRIRHRVLAASAGLEVVELAAPAVHATFADAGMPLPNCAEPRPQRTYDGGRQRFVFHRAEGAAWVSGAGPDGGGAGASEGAGAGCEGGAEGCDLGIAAATGGLARVRSLRGAGVVRGAAPPAAGVDFLFLVDGAAELTLLGGEAEAAPPVALGAGDACALPPGAAFALALGAGATALQLTMQSLD